jgi:L-alanine-DL-glutamate epimerase-like enolase superfamily enzyme
MKVTKINAVPHPRPPAPDPLRDALQVLGGAGTVEVRIETDEGIAGRGDVYFGRIAGGPETLAALVERELAPVALGTDPTMVRATHEAMLRETEYHGSFGLAMWGIAAVDTALWDCLGKAHGVPCWKLWGAVHDRIPAYAMVGWLNYSDDKVQRVCARAVEQGYRAVKIKVGFETLQQDVKRVELVRRAVGGETRLMVDANQALTTAEAIRRGRAFQDLGCYWWEEPLPAQDADGYAALAEALDIPVATGENLYTKHDFARFLRHNAVDIVQPDLRRAGGPTALLQIGLMADAFRRPYASHGGEAAQMNVMACLPNALYVELGLLSADSPMKLEDGCVNLPQAPGLAWD